MALELGPGSERLWKSFSATGLKCGSEIAVRFAGHERVIGPAKL